MLSFLELLGGNTLTRLVMFPLLAVIPLLWARSNRGLRWYLLSVSMLELVFGGFLLRGRFDGQGALRPIRELGTDGAALDWIPSMGVSFDLGLDGISLPLVALTLLLLPVSILGSWSRTDLRWSVFGSMILLASTAILGALLSLDLFLFSVFWEALLIPVLFLIGFGGGGRRIRSAMKFFVLAVASDLLMLLAILRLALHHFQTMGHWSFSYVDLVRLDLPLEEELWLLAAFALAFAVRLALFPLHTWLPDAYSHAPTASSILIGGLVLSLGAYGFLRFALPLFPNACLRARPLFVTLAVIGMLFGAMSAWIQTDLRKLLAYGSISHLSLVMLGIFTFDLLAWEGASIHLVHHGLAMTTLLLLAGMLHERRASWKVDDLAGLARSTPLLAFSLGIGCFSLAGVPLLSGFVGEITILSGAFRSLAGEAPWIPLAATVALLFTTLYLLRLLHTVVFGPLDGEARGGLTDLLPREILTLAPLLLLMLALGLAPNLLIQKSRLSLYRMHQQFQGSLQSEPDGPTLSSTNLGHTRGSQE